MLEFKGDVDCEDAIEFVSILVPVLSAGLLYLQSGFGVSANVRHCSHALAKCSANSRSFFPFLLVHCLLFGKLMVWLRLFLLLVFFSLALSRSREI